MITQVDASLHRGRRQSWCSRSLNTRSWYSGASLLALSLALASTPHPAGAQDAEDQAMEEMIVTGIRGSLKRSADIKKNSDAFVDALSAEGIGDFPDTNLAEALQRITGVSIDRSNGEGEFVSVRGFGPEFNTVLVNGRQMPTTNDGRQFSFDTIPSELVSQLLAYKTSPVQLQSGGIGSTINVFTPRPLDRPGLRVDLSAEGLYEEASDQVTPRLFAAVSNTFADDTIGVTLAAAYQRRDTKITSVETRGFNRLTVGADPDNLGPGEISPLAFAGTAPAAGTTIFSPQNYDQIVNFEERERISVNGAVQYEPTQDLLFTIDGLYSEFTVESDVESLGNWFGTLSTLDNVVLDENNSVVSLSRLETGRNPGESGAIDFIQRSFNRPDKLWSAGFNTQWQATESITVTYDAAYSEATSRNGGRDRFVVAGFFGTVDYDNPGGGALPSLTGTPADLGTNFDAPNAHIAIEEGFGTSDSFSDEIFETRLDAEWRPTEFGILSTVKAGALYSTREKANTEIATDPDVLCLYCGYFLDVPNELFSTFNTGSFISRSGDVPTEFLVFDPDALIAFLEQPDTALARDAALGLTPGTTQAILDANDGFTAAVQPSSFQIEEDIFEAYIDFGFEGEFLGRPWRGSAGFRFSHTEVTAIGEQQVLLDLEPIPFDPTLLNGVFADDPAVTTIENDYTKFLPNVTVIYEPFDNVIARFAYSRTLTRPSPVDLAPRVNFDVLRPDGLLASGGNPDLEPFESDNIDVSLEWYYMDDSAITFAYFRKDVEGFIVSGVEPQTFPIASDPNGATFQVRRPINGEDAVVDGFEISLVHNFTHLPEPFNGFGVQANATFVDSNREFDTTTLATSFGIEGISNTQNVVAYYDNYGLEVRVAWNRRDGFLAELANAVGGDPIFVEAFDQFDARASYQVHDYVTVFFEAINFTNSLVERRGRFENQVLNIIDTGPRFSLGVRASF